MTTTNSSTTIGTVACAVTIERARDDRDVWVVRIGGAACGYHHHVDSAVRHARQLIEQLGGTLAGDGAAKAAEMEISR